MIKHNKHEASTLTIVQAVETLSHIADLNLDQETGISQTHAFAIQGQPVVYRTIHWLHEQDAEKTIAIVKETFKVVLKYLKHFYRKEYGYLTDAQTIEGIKTVMVLVGEAAKKLDKYAAILHGPDTASVTTLEEYRALQEFYQRRIAQKIDEGQIGKWILAITKQLPEREAVLKPRTMSAEGEMASRIFIDLESVKKDTEYELFFLRKEDGTRFFNARLMRNIKLVCDFGSYFGDYRGDDPIGAVRIWQDSLMHGMADNIYHAIRDQLSRYYPDTARQRDSELVESLNKALMALMLAANPRHLLRNRPIKSCTEYFCDFQTFLRQALCCREYQKLTAYPPKKTQPLRVCLLETIHALCKAFYLENRAGKELEETLSLLIHEAKGVQRGTDIQLPWWEQLIRQHSAVNQLLKLHPNGPLVKVLELLEEGATQLFDPLFQQNLPRCWDRLQMERQRTNQLHMACPVYQEFIDKAFVNDEFRACLHAMAQEADKGRFLLVNLQDRTSWQEHARCVAVEELQTKADFKEIFTAITLAMDTDFYYQLTPYHHVNHAEAFLTQFKEHLESDATGFYFPKAVRKVLFPHFTDHLLSAVHRLFFGGRNVLLRQERLDFISLIYCFLILKVLETFAPRVFAFSCKDGVDTSSAMGALLFALLSLCSREGVQTPEFLDHLWYLFTSSAILVRERNILADRFNRAVSAIKAVALVREELGSDAFHQTLVRELASLFKTDMDTWSCGKQRAFPPSLEEAA